MSEVPAAFDDEPVEFDGHHARVQGEVLQEVFDRLLAGPLAAFPVEQDDSVVCSSSHLGQRQMHAADGEARGNLERQSPRVV